MQVRRIGGAVNAADVRQASLNHAADTSTEAIQKGASPGASASRSMTGMTVIKYGCGAAVSMLPSA